MPKAKIKPKEEKKFGITPYAVALVYEGRTPDEDRDVFHADNPSVYAEARLGIASRREAEQAFAQLIDDILTGRCKTELPSLREWISETKGKLSFDDLEARVQQVNGTKALTSLQAVKEPVYNSKQGTLAMDIRSRSAATAKDTLSYWNVTMANFEIDGRGLNPVFWRKCQCRFQGKTANKRRLFKNTGAEKEFLDSLIAEGIITDRDVRKPLDLACYHEAVIATKAYMQAEYGIGLDIPNFETVRVTIPFDLIKRWDLVFEAAARKYKFGQDMAEIDEYLWQHDIMTGKFREYMQQGVIHKEVIKSERFFDPIAKKIIMAIYKRMHERGYKYKGFSREFIGFSNKRKSYECNGIVFEKNEISPDVSYRIVYSTEANINPPFIVEKRFYNPDQKQPKPVKYQRSPLRLWEQDKSINTLDDRTGKVADTSISAPTKHVLALVPESEEQYAKVWKFYKDHPVRKR